MLTQYFALLAIGSLGTAAGVASSWPFPGARRWWAQQLKPWALPAAAVVAVVTLIGSLYLSEVLNYVPCRLCWIQRAFAYPLAFILPTAVAFRKPKLHIVAAPLSILGALVSGYHIAIERFPSLEGSGSCDPTNPCSLVWIRHYGFVTIPVMALAAFLLQLALLTISRTDTP